MKQHTKTLGQVFLNDPNIIQKIIQLANPKPSEQIIEIGCGKGILSKELYSISKNIHIIEIDSRWIEYVQEELPNATYHLQDILTFDFKKLPNKSTIISNLPYQITTPILSHIATNKSHINACTIMIQKEVAQRILAPSNCKEYGLLTIFCNYHFHCKKGFNVSRNCFYPKPNVDSYVLQLIPKKSALNKTDEALFFALTKSLFWGRRKTMLTCLKKSPYIHYSPKKTIKTNQLTKRGETLSLDQLFLLFNELKPDIQIKPVQ